MKLPIALIFSFAFGSIASARPFATRTANEIQVSLHHGYLDNQPKSLYVGGKLVQEWTAYLLSLECQGNPLKYLCEYNLEMGSANEFVMSKTFQTNNGPVKVIIHDISPNITDNDNLNRTTYKIQQVQQSAKAKSEFLKAAATSDILLYLGHSRYGGGPDFDLPVLDSDRHHDMSYYQGGKFTGFKDLLSAFAKSPRLPAYFGLLSCSSGPHFGGKLQRSYPSVNYIFTSEVQTQNAEQGARKAFQVLHSLLLQNLQD